MAMRNSKKAQFTVKSPKGTNIKFSMLGRVEFGVTGGGFLSNMDAHETPAIQDSAVRNTLGDGPSDEEDAPACLGRNGGEHL
jgi:hypothetical protein